MKKEEKKQLDHIAINVEDICESVSWYLKNLDAHVAYQDETWAMLHFCDGSRIALTVASQHPPHIAFRVNSLKDFPSGADIKQHRDGSHYHYADDPSGNTIEWVCYNAD